MQCLEQDVDPAEEAELRRLEGGAGAAEEASEDESEQVDQGGEEEADAAVPVTLLEVRLPPPYPEDGSSTHRLRILVQLVYCSIQLQYSTNTVPPESLVLENRNRV